MNEIHKALKGAKNKNKPRVGITSVKKDIIPAINAGLKRYRLRRIKELIPTAAGDSFAILEPGASDYVIAEDFPCRRIREDDYPVAVQSQDRSRIHIWKSGGVLQRLTLILLMLIQLHLEFVCLSNLVIFRQR